MYLLVTKMFLATHLLTVVTGQHNYAECMVCSSLSLFTLRVTHARYNQLSVVLLTFTSLGWLWRQFDYYV